MKDTAKFKNITEQTLTVIGVGIIGPGEIVELPANFHNANFRKEVKEIKDKEIKTNKNKDL